MRILKYFAMLSFVALFVSSCETYDDVKVDYSPIFPMSGEWNVTIVNSTTGAQMIYTDKDGKKTSRWTIITSNTADNATNKMWIRQSNKNLPELGQFCGKIDVDVAGKTFTGTDIIDTYTNSVKLTVKGNVVIDGYATPSGGKADKISFTIQSTKKPGQTYTVEGFRRTFWPEDE